MKLRINKACDLASISVLPPRNTRGSRGGGISASTSAAAKAGAAVASQQRSQSMSQQSLAHGGGGSFSQSFGASFSQGRGASFSQSRGGGGMLFSQGSGSGGSAFSQGGGGGLFSQGGASGGAALSQGGRNAGVAFSQGGGDRGAEFSQGGGGGGASFSQGGGGGGAAFSQGGSGGVASFSQGGGSASLLHSQSQISQASHDKHLLSLLHPSHARDQDDLSKRMSSFPVNSASCMRDESQQQLTKISSNPVHRWSTSLPDSRCHINEDVERKFQHVASSVHKMGMVLDSVQDDVMQLNRAMKEASLDSGSIQKKFVLVETCLQQILKGQDDLKALLEGSTKSNPDQMGVLNSQTSKLDEISSTLSVFKEVQEELKQLKGDIFSVLTKEMEDLSCTTKGKSMINQTSAKSPLVNQRPVADGRQQKKPTGVANGRPRKKQKPVANGRPRKKQKPVASGRPKRKETAVANGRPRMSHAQMADEISKMNEVPEATGKPRTKQVPTIEVLQTPKPKEVAAQKVNPQVASKKQVAETKLPQAPKPEEVAAQNVNPQVATKKAPLNVIIDLDEEEDEEGSDRSVSCVMLKTRTGAGGELMCEEAMSEDATEILQRARKRRRMEENKAIAPLPRVAADRPRQPLMDSALTGTRRHAQREVEGYLHVSARGDGEY